MNNIKRARKLNGMTVYDVAQKVGITAGAVSRIERGLSGVRPSNAKKLAETLGISIEEVIFPEEKAACPDSCQ